MKIERKNDIWLLVLSWAVLIVVIIAFATSCSPRKQLAKLEYKHPELLLQFCASKAITDTVIIKQPGYYILPSGDTVHGNVPDVNMPDVANPNDAPTSNVNTEASGKNEKGKSKTTNKATKPIYVPPTKTIIVHTVDTSGKALLRSENSRLTDENNTLQGKISTWQFWAVFGYVLVIVLAVVIGVFVRVK